MAYPNKITTTEFLLPCRKGGRPTGDAHDDEKHHLGRPNSVISVERIIICTQKYWVNKTGMYKKLHQYAHCIKFLSLKSSKFLKISSCYVNLLRSQHDHLWVKGKFGDITIFRGARHELLSV